MMRRIGRFPAWASVCRTLLVLVVFAAMGQVWGGRAPDAASQVAQRATEPLQIQSDNGTHTFSVEIADTPEKRSRGLMFRRGLPADAGMLFLFRPPQRVAMWMRNTFIPLDMLFLDETGRIVRIIERTVPHSEEILSANRPVSAVLELNGGTVNRLGVSTGDRVVHPAFQ